jgi:DNA-binding SARP family transcriptional activator
VDPYGGAVEFLLLGPLEVRAGSRTVPLRSPKQRVLLAALLVNAGRAVRVDELVEMMWGSTPPDNPRGAVQIHVNRLRTTLGTELITTGPAGYRIDVAPADVDIGRLRLAVAAADRAARRGDLPGEDAALTGALALWRGEPLVDVPAEPLHREVVPGLGEQRAVLWERWAAVRLRMGRHAELLGELRALTAQYPLRERFWAQLMTALHRDGQQAEALEAYQVVRGLLAEELGVDPGPELRRAHAAVLSGDDEGAEDAGRAAGAAGAGPDEEGTAASDPTPWVVRSELPMDVVGFVGREETVIGVAEALLRRDEVPLVVVSGAPGVGKSALAIRVAHQLRPGFPDGQWFVRLDGAGPAPRAPEHVLDAMLRAAGVDMPSAAGDLQQRSALLRSRLAGHQVLIVFDDAADAAQVEPLLPGSPGCAVLVTSRNDLAGLTARYGARRRPLDVLSADGAVDLITEVIGAVGGAGPGGPVRPPAAGAADRGRQPRGPPAHAAGRAGRRAARRPAGRPHRPRRPAPRGPYRL